MEKKKVKYFVVENCIKNLPVLAEKVDKLAGEWELPDPLTLKINLVLEEALSNIILYGFNDKAKHEIKISLSLKERTITLKITDNGVPFDPSTMKQPDINLPAEERPVGGLGVYLINKIMDAVHYTRKNNLNILTLNKNI